PTIRDLERPTAADAASVAFLVRGDGNRFVVFGGGTGGPRRRGSAAGAGPGADSGGRGRRATDLGALPIRPGEEPAAPGFARSGRRARSAFRPQAGTMAGRGPLRQTARDQRRI